MFNCTVCFKEFKYKHHLTNHNNRKKKCNKNDTKNNHKMIPK